MAPVRATVSASLALLSFLIVSSAIAVAAGRHGHRGGSLGRIRRTQLHFYFQEINSGPNRSVVRAAPANTTNASPTSFGAVVVADNPLTEGPELTSRLLGRAQGIYTSSSQTEIAFTTAMNYVFTGGKYNGSVVTMLGRNAIANAVREMAVVGGSGYFRLARGYALIRTYRLNPTGLVTVEYNVTVIHPRL